MNTASALAHSIRRTACSRFIVADSCVQELKRRTVTGRPASHNSQQCQGAPRKTLRQYLLMSRGKIVPRGRGENMQPEGVRRLVTL
jgi:hypothetical protein